MDAGIADTLNRVTADKIAKHLDLTDWLCGVRADSPASGTPWHLSWMATTFLDGAATNTERAWLLGALAVKTPGIDFDAIPADEDWENLFSSLRTEIITRRDPKTPHGEVAKICPAGVV